MILLISFALISFLGEGEGAGKWPPIPAFRGSLQLASSVWGYGQTSWCCFQAGGLLFWSLNGQGCRLSSVEEGLLADLHIQVGLLVTGCVMWEQSNLLAFMVGKDCWQVFLSVYGHKLCSAIGQGCRMGSVSRWGYVLSSTVGWSHRLGSKAARDHCQAPWSGRAKVAE